MIDGWQLSTNCDCKTINLCCFVFYCSRWGERKLLKAGVGGAAKAVKEAIRIMAVGVPGLSRQRFGRVGVQRRGIWVGIRFFKVSSWWKWQGTNQQKLTFRLFGLSIDWQSYNQKNLKNIYRFVIPKFQTKIRMNKKWISFLRYKHKIITFTNRRFNREHENDLLQQIENILGIIV